MEEKTVHISGEMQTPVSGEATPAPSFTQAPLKGLSDPVLDVDRGKRGAR